MCVCFVDLFWLVFSLSVCVCVCVCVSPLFLTIVTTWNVKSSGQPAFIKDHFVKVLKLLRSLVIRIKVVGIPPNTIS